MNAYVNFIAAVYAHGWENALEVSPVTGRQLLIPAHNDVFGAVESLGGSLAAATVDSVTAFRRDGVSRCGGVVEVRRRPEPSKGFLAMFWQQTKSAKSLLHVL